MQHLLGLPDSTPNPHLWYKPSTMPAVAKAVAADLAPLQPAHAAYFPARVAAFDRSLQPWYQALAQFKARYPGTPVATTEPVGDYLLQAAGTRNLTPFAFQADVMNGVDPAPQYVSLQDGLFSGHKVKVFLYNQQVTDSLTASFLAAAHRDGIPVVGVYETMPEPGYDYQSWMLAETHRAAAGGGRPGSPPRSSSCMTRPAGADAATAPRGTPANCSTCRASASGCPAGRSSTTSASPCARASSPA